MSFRIDIAHKDEAIITLVVVRNQINILVTATNQKDRDTPTRVRNNFLRMSDNLTLDHMQSSIRGADAEHIKRHHGSPEEVNLPHAHVSFDKDVTPELLKQFLEGIL